MEGSMSNNNYVRNIGVKWDYLGRPAGSHAKEGQAGVRLPQPLLSFCHTHPCQVHWPPLPAPQGLECEYEGREVSYHLTLQLCSTLCGPSVEWGCCYQRAQKPPWPWRFTGNTCEDMKSAVTSRAATQAWYLHMYLDKHYLSHSSKHSVPHTHLQIPCHTHVSEHSSPHSHWWYSCHTYICIHICTHSK